MQLFVSVKIMLFLICGDGFCNVIDINSDEKWYQQLKWNQSPENSTAKIQETKSVTKSNTARLLRLINT